MSAEHLFFLASGNLALDLLNTAQGMGGEHDDLLRSPEELRAWLAAADLVGAGTRQARLLESPPAARILLGEAHGLRDDVDRAAEAVRSGSAVPSHVLYGIDRVLGASRRSTSLVAGPEGPRLVESETGDSLLTLLAPVARAAAELAVGADPRRIRRCASETCTRWFIDTSKGGRRKWCSMAVCGNRAKAAGHRRRQATR